MDAKKLHLDAILLVLAVPRSGRLRKLPAGKKITYPHRRIPSVSQLCSLRFFHNLSGRHQMGGIAWRNKLG
jgi:hypothetical protein